MAGEPAKATSEHLDHKLSSGSEALWQWARVGRASALESEDSGNILLKTGGKEGLDWKVVETNEFGTELDLRCFKSFQYYSKSCTGDSQFWLCIWNTLRVL